MTNEAIILDTPNQIEGYRLLAIVHGLRMEIDMQAKGWPPRSLPTRGRALRAAQQTLAQYKVQGARAGTRKSALRSMLALCQQLGIETTVKEN